MPIQPFLHLLKVTDPEEATNGCWFGGLPRLGGQAWPRGFIDAEPLTFIAQVDLGALPQGPWTAELPSNGSLAFFLTQSEEVEPLDHWPIDRTQDAVVFIADPGVEETPMPADTPPIGGYHWQSYKTAAGRVEDAPRLLRQWPMRVIAVAEPYENVEEKEALIAQHEASSNPPYHTRESGKMPIYPYAVMFAFIEMVRAHVTTTAEAVLQSVSELETQIADNDPAELILPADLRRISTQTNAISSAANRSRIFPEAIEYAFFDRIRSDIENWQDLDGVKQSVYQRWIAGHPKTYHQMFGTGPFIERENTHYHDYHLLGRFSEDGALGWNTSGMRDVKFLISADALRRRDWAAAFVDHSNGA